MRSLCGETPKKDITILHHEVMLTIVEGAIQI